MDGGTGNAWTVVAASALVKGCVVLGLTLDGRGCAWNSGESESECMNRGNTGLSAAVEGEWTL